MKREYTSAKTKGQVPDIEPPFHGYLSGVSYFGFSQRGESHKKSKKPCQDRCAAAVLEAAHTLIVAIADGVGSCDLSDLGAYTAVHAVTDEIAKKLSERQGVALDDAFAGQLLRAAMQYAYDKVEQTAEDNKQLMYSLQSTLTVAIYDGETVYFAHAGDDGIVALTADGILELATIRHKGEEANSVYPLQNKSTWQFGKISKTVAFVMATDGVLDAFVKSSAEKNRVYYPFIEPIITSDSRSSQDVQKLCQDFYNYMASLNYRNMVTDDLTLVAVVNHNKIHKKMLPAFDLDAWNLETSKYTKRRNAVLYPQMKKEEKEQKKEKKTPDVIGSTPQDAREYVETEDKKIIKVKEKKEFPDYYIDKILIGVLIGLIIAIMFWGYIFIKFFIPH